MRRLDLFILSVATAVSLTIFSGVYLVLYRGIQETVKENALRQAEGIAKETSSDMYQIMKKGWKRKELLEFLKGIEEAHRESGVKVRIYRGDLVKKLFGEIEEPPKGKDVMEAFTYRKATLSEKEGKLIYAYPLIAGRECLKCHINAKEGDVLGVVEVVQDISFITSSVKRSLLAIVIFTLPLPIFGALLIVLIIRSKIISSLERLDRTFEHINKVSELSKISMEDYDFGFEEINRVRGSMQKLISRMQKIAVDKDILEFEIRLLEKFIITSEAVTDWETFLKSILAEISGFLKYIYFYVVFREDQDKFLVKAFWRVQCPEGNGMCKREFEKRVLEELKESVLWVEGAQVKFEHTEIDGVEVLEDCGSCPFKEIRTFSRTLLLDRPLISGAVGIGVSVDEAESEVKKIAIEGLLATILNIVSSIRAINKYTQELEYFATRDPLTGLYNQRVFWELLEYEVERAKRHAYSFSLFLIDIDNFKLINDTYGHNLGDQFLKEVASVLRNIFRREDIVARYGGDEFAVIAPYIGPRETETVARRLLETFERFSMPAPDGKMVKATASVGIAIFPDHAEDAMSLFVLADNMMYRAKREGKDRYAIATSKELEEIEKEITSKSFMILETLERRRVIPYFQPILNLKEDRVEAYEVLMRIEYGGEILPAGEFISIAENMGVIHKLDYIFMEKAIERVMERGCEPMLFFNLSPKAIILSEFISEVERLVERTGYRREKIVFEITERETVRNLGMLRKFVEALKMEGFKFAVDDFGSGFASFTYLKLLPIDLVKIDGDFIRSMHRSEVDRAFVEGAVSMAKALRIKTVAEWVESEDILNAVKGVGIDYAQGYLIGKPSEEVC